MFISVFLIALVTSAIFLFVFRQSLMGFRKKEKLIAVKKIGIAMVSIYTVLILVISFFITNDIVSRALVISAVSQIPFAVMIIRTLT